MPNEEEELGHWGTRKTTLEAREFSRVVKETLSSNNLTLKIHSVII